ncbi:hypothetical protein BOH66_02675 [Microbacterium aurum]|uniref:Uncharacterized protein n=1 Tax=Microbacterium aurum TaxID=36805 RepID=A0A1P8U5C9_9MICO|nr:hypothetical protein [Microbacterium aurum]APZ33313.1 hypothetical protein BOH66_02675 [Microbacterium aurum]MBM7826934.1 hypothetical protein [Microbacterium aurum]
MTSLARKDLAATNRTKTRLTSAIIATILAVSGSVVAAAPASAASRIVGPFQSMTHCQAERRLWIREGYSPQACIKGPNNVTYYFWVDY